MHAYFLTVHKTLDPKSPSDCRTVGYFPSEDVAVEVLRDNKQDIHEDCYDYATIEMVGDGLYSTDRKTTFYKWCPLVSGYVWMDKPARLAHFLNFSGIG